MAFALGLMLVLALAGMADAQTYSRCVDAAGRVHLTDGPAPSGVHCVSQVTRELQDTPRRASATGRQHALWITEPSGMILVRTFESAEACQAARDTRISSAVRPVPEVVYRCAPAGLTP